MWKGIYKRWNPIPQLEGARLYCEAVHDDREGFRLWFDGEPSDFPGVVVVRFEERLLYANSDEGSRTQGIENFSEMQLPHTFWKVEESALVEEFHLQSNGIYRNEEITHYAFLSCTDCIDVLSRFEPTFDYDIDDFDRIQTNS